MKTRPGATIFKKILGGIWWLMICGLFLFGGCIFGKLYRSELLRKVILMQVKKPQESFSSDAQTFLILGCDEDVYYQSQYVLKHAARSDMMLVARMDFTKGEITGVSI